MEFAPFPRKCRKCGNEFDQLELEIIEGVPVEDSQEAEEASA
jgi:predicted Zn-ribbon and HTH transcriptional regulator